MATIVASIDMVCTPTGIATVPHTYASSLHTQHTHTHTHLVDVISFSGGGDTEALPIHRLHLKVADVTVHLPPRRGAAPIAEHRLCSGGGGELPWIDYLPSTVAIQMLLIQCNSTWGNFTVNQASVCLTWCVLEGFQTVRIWRPTELLQQIKFTLEWMYV